MCCQSDEGRLTQMQMLCPKCQNLMQQYERNGIHIDQCVECKGLFLDRGELEHLMQAEAAYYSSGPGAAPSAPAAPPPPPRHDDRGYDRGFPGGGYPGGYGGKYARGGRYGGGRFGGKYAHGRRRRGGFLENLLDFG